MRFGKLSAAMAVAAASSAGFLAGQAYATKPTISNDAAAKKADIIAVASVVSETQVRKPAQDQNGNWTKERRRVRAQLSQVIKCELRQEVDFDVDDLTFDKGKDFVIFLKASPKLIEDEFGKKTVLLLDYVDGPSRRVEATEHEIKAVKALLGQDPAVKEPKQ